MERPNHCGVLRSQLLLDLFLVAFQIKSFSAMFVDQDSAATLAFWDAVSESAIVKHLTCENQPQASL